MATQETCLGVDIGTSVAKAVVFDRAGTALAVRGREIALELGPHGAVEQDIDAVLAATGEVCRAVVDSLESPPDTMSLTGQGDGCWLLDDAFRPVRKAMSWMDGRAGPIVDRWTADGVTDEVFRHNGNAMFAGMIAPLLAWLDEHEPDSLDRAATAAHCKDVVFGTVTGVRATDISEASMPWADPAGDGYSDEVLKLTGLSDRRHLLPAVQGPLPIAELSDHGAELTGLPAGTTVVSGPFDFPACSIGAGVRQPGDGLLIVGTTLGCLVLVDELVRTGTPAGYHVATPDPDRWYRAMPAMVGTASMDWLLRILGVGVEAIDPAFDESPPGANGTEVLPFLAPSGERAPFVDPFARAQLGGLRMTTTRADLIRGLCEGLAYAARSCFEAAGLSGDLTVAGGGTKSRPWMQLFADVLGRPLPFARTPEVGARGSVISALAARGIDIDVDRWTAPEDVVEPATVNAGRYDDGYGRYLEQLAAARPLWATHPAANPAASPAAGTQVRSGGAA